MRRSPSLVLLAAIAAVSVVVVTLSAASAEPPGDTADTGNFYVDPDPPTVGQTVKLTANFPSGSFDVTFYERTGPDTWTSIGTDASNDSGNAYLYTHVVDGPEELYARITSGGEGRTEVKTVTPIPADAIAPTGTVRGSLAQSPSTFADGAQISMTANFPDGTFPITLYREVSANAWSAVATKQSSSSGNATFTGVQVTGTQRYFARKANNDRTEVDVVTPTPEATLSIRRNCSGNTCGTTATAYGELDPAQQGRSIRLQYKSGTSWKSLGSAATTGADGKVQIPFSVSGLSQWSARTYRLSVASSGSSPSLKSNQIQFMPGPTQLGTNVLRVDVEDGVFPTTKGPEYPGEATLSVNGAVAHDHLPVDGFGVRGNTTAKFVKKPYKLKFVDKPPKNTTVFGMPRGKNWTLLANFKDQSAVRDKIGLDLGRRLGNIAWTPESRYVELFVNDQYRGAYLMTESVKIDGDRVDIDETHGMIMETDGSTVEDPLLGFKAAHGIVFAFKDPDEVKSGADFPEGVTPAKLDAIRTRINLFESKLYQASTRAQYPDFIDVGSAIDFHLLQEFVKNGDGAFYRSHYFSWDPSDPTGASGNPLRDGKFHFGPAWDFDGSAGNPCCDSSTEYFASTEDWIMRGTGSGSTDATYRTQWFAQLFKDAAFEAAVEQRWAEVRTEFEKVFTTEVAAAKAAIGVGAANDRNRWASEPKPRASRGTYNQEVAFVQNWYEDRFAWMDAQLTN